MVYGNLSSQLTWGSQRSFLCAVSSALVVTVSKVNSGLKNLTGSGHIRDSRENQFTKQIVGQKIAKLQQVSCGCTQIPPW